VARTCRWRPAAQWEQVIPPFALPQTARRIIYTTNAIESLNTKLRRAVRTCGHFPTDDAATKLLFLVLQNAAAEWKRSPHAIAIARVLIKKLFGRA
jgi:putative transposase